jgi:hypothetical protein
MCTCRRAWQSRGSWNTLRALLCRAMPRKPLDGQRTERTFCHAVGVGSSMSKSRAVAAHAHPVCSVPDLFYARSLSFKTVHSSQTRSSAPRGPSTQADPSVHHTFPVAALPHMPSRTSSVRGFPPDIPPALLQTVRPSSTC